MENETTSGTSENLVTIQLPACEASQLLKMTPQEPRFTLRAQDISAALVVEFWALTNLYLRQRDRVGILPERALEEIQQALFKVFPVTHEPIDQKINGAFQTAVAMTKWPTKHLAD